MATSGSYNFSQTRDEIISAALRKCGVLGAGETATADQAVDASEDLNRLCKAWDAMGTHLWKKRDIVVFTEANKSSYSLGLTGDHASASYVKTELSTAGVATDLTIEVDSITGISASDNIGIVLDDGTLHWTTVNGAPSGTTVTITVALPSAAAIDNHVYTYTTKTIRPLRVMDARYKSNDGNEVYMRAVSEREYFELSTKTSDGNPTEFYYNPSLTNGTLYVYPQSNSVNDTIHLNVEYPMEDFDATADTPDLPQEWLDALVWNLAKKIAPEYNVGAQRYAMIKEEALESLILAEGFDSEYASIRIEYDDR